MSGGQMAHEHVGRAALKHIITNLGVGAVALAQAHLVIRIGQEAHTNTRSLSGGADI